ncbi:MAG: FapA family protein [Geobacteraceae bacterium]|nr:FapA family protein [Geobacteraceae bacterium]
MGADTSQAPVAAAAGTSGGIAGKECRKLGYSLYIWVSDDSLECRCSYVPHEQGSMITLDELKDFLAASGVKEGFIEEAIEAFAVKAAAGQALSMMLVASGIPPVPGKDGWLSYTAQPSVTVSEVVDEAENIDLHNVQTFINVMPGDEIGRIIPPESGTAGRSVTGQAILPPPPKPLNIKIGDNIRTSDDGTKLFADVAGRVCTGSGEISVAQEYVVAGDVDFRVGSIVFNGHVEVRGDILDGFNVTAVKGLRVNGNIGACQIKSDGDIFLCGMDGMEKGTIECGGSIKANFIHDCALVECAGDVIADVELHNCHVKALGKIVVNKGAIAGGSYTALQGIETRKAGSASSIRTTLRAGFDYRDMPELERIAGELEKNTVQMEQTSSFQDLEVLRNTRAELTEKLMAIRTLSAEKANPKINVKSILYDNTFVRVGLNAKEKVDERDGPFSVIENTIEGGLRFLSMTSLDVRAADIEMAFIREAARKHPIHL